MLRVTGYAYDRNRLPRRDKNVITQFFRAQGRSYVTWAAYDSGSDPPAAEAGLALLDEESMVPSPIGKPYYRGLSPPGYYELGFNGAWDPEQNVFWADSPDHEYVSSVTLDAQVIDTRPINGHPPYLVNWIKLGDGRWAGGHMARWLRFSTFERTDWHEPNPIGTWHGLFSDSSANHFRDYQGNTWIAGVWRNLVEIRRYTDTLGTATAPHVTELWRTVCPPRE